MTSVSVRNVRDMRDALGMISAVMNAMASLWSSQRDNSFIEYMIHSAQGINAHYIGYALSIRAKTSNRARLLVCLKPGM